MREVEYAKKLKVCWDEKLPARTGAKIALRSKPRFQARNNNDDAYCDMAEPPLEERFIVPMYDLKEPCAICGHCSC